MHQGSLWPCNLRCYMTIGLYQNCRVMLSMQFVLQARQGRIDGPALGVRCMSRCSEVPV